MRVSLISRQVEPDEIDRAWYIKSLTYMPAKCMSREGRVLHIAERPAHQISPMAGVGERNFWWS